MAVATLQTFPKVEVGGSRLSNELEALLDEVVVDTHLHLPDMFTIRFLDPDRRVLSRAHLEMGTTVKISGTEPGGRAPELLIKGEVTAIEAEYGAHESFAIVRGYDMSHRLHRGRSTETYRNVKDSDIARTVARRAGLTVGTVDDSGGTHEHVSQANQSNWDFLKGRAREIGFEMSVVDGKFNFRRPVSSSTAPGSGDYNSTNSRQLVLGQDLVSFRPRVTSAEQVTEVKARGWDSMQKQAVIGSAQAGTNSATVPATPSRLANSFGGQKFLLADRPLSTQGQVDAAARSVAEQIGSSVAEAEGVARGIPKLRAGTAVSISEVMRDFIGTYTLSHTRHIFDRAGYYTHFEVTGRQERSLLGLASMGGTNGSASAGGPPIPGLVIGLVTANSDPDNLGRVKLKFPWLSNNYETDWCRVMQLGAGPNSGALFLPEVNDEVVVGFEFGDIRRPYVIGSLYNGQDKPRLGNGLFDNGKVKRRGFVSRKGHKFIFFDDDSKKGVALITSDGQVKISLNETGKEIKITCGSGKVTLTSQGDMTLESQGNIKLKAQADVKIEAQSGLALKGASQAKLESTGSVEITNGGAKIAMQGPEVNINSGALQVM